MRFLLIGEDFGRCIRKEVRSMNVPTEVQTRSQRDMSARSYDRVSSIYERLAVLFTGGQNLATRMSQLEDMHPGQRVLYVGVGPGEEALEAASRGIKVTCVDLSPSMVETVRKRFEKAGLPGEFVCADIMEYQPAQPFDVVVANFFLNVFSRPVMEKIMARLVSLVRPGGDFVVADFGAPRGNVFLLRPAPALLLPRDHFSPPDGPVCLPPDLHLRRLLSKARADRSEHATFPAVHPGARPMDLSDHAGGQGRHGAAGATAVNQFRGAS